MNGTAAPLLSLKIKNSIYQFSCDFAGRENRSVPGVHEDLEPPGNAGVPSAVGFSTTAND